MNRTVRAFEVADIDMMINYFLQADEAFLRGMGVDPGKLPSARDWRQLLLEDFGRPIEHRTFYYVLWQVDDVPVGHSNINKIRYGQEAYMHLHLWQPEQRRQGNGTFFVQASIGHYFEHFRLQTLYCEAESGPQQNPGQSRV